MQSRANSQGTQRVQIGCLDCVARAQVAAQPIPAPSTAAQASPTSVPGTLSTSASTQAADTITATGPFKAYRVQAGDTVRFVAEMYGVSSASIIQASGLPNPDRLRIGQVLTVPNQPGWLYRIQPGETLDLIAARTGVATDLIASASSLSNCWTVGMPRRTQVSQSAGTTASFDRP